MTEKSAAIVLDSSRSTQISLEAIREGNAGLNTHRQGVLDRAPEVGDSAIFKREALKLIDLAYLTAKTGHEFAILRGKDLDILFHGDFGHCEFAIELFDFFIEIWDAKIRLIENFSKKEFEKAVWRWYIGIRWIEN